jgi:ABC-type polysaccharide/polyol phosphate transport system ATPase subunit
MATRESDYAIEFRDVSRRFVLHHERRASFQDWFIGLIRPRGIAEEFWALRNVNFGIRRGETIGIIGRNGAGKSTLLKLVTRILEPSHGRVIVNGRTYAMLELGSGFHPELSGRDNIYLNGSLYGFSRKQMSQRYDDIVRFAELERFIDTPVKHYSSGMYARLGFGIAVNMDPEILVIDEVLAVGDATFQEKCFRALEQLKGRGTTILFVSHDADSVRRFCDRAVLISGGLLEDIGPADEVVDHYERQLVEDVPQARLLRVRAVDFDGQTLDTVQSGSDIRIDILLRVPPQTSTVGLALRLDVSDDAGTHLFSSTTSLPASLPGAPTSGQRPTDEPDTRVASGFIRRLPIASGTLHLVVTLLGDQFNGDSIIDRQEALLRVNPTDVSQTGLLLLDHRWSWNDHAGEPVTSPQPVSAAQR